MRPKLIYFAYPYSSDPLERTEEIKKLVRAVVDVRKDIVPIVPHVTFDALFDYPTGYSHFFIGRWELEIISRCDYICFAPTDIKSLGCVWEREFAIWADTPIVDYAHLLEGGEI